jgi:hypothetical protein
VCHAQRAVVAPEHLKRQRARHTGRRVARGPLPARAPPRSGPAANDHVAALALPVGTSRAASSRFLSAPDPSQFSSRQASTPSLIARAAMTSAAAGSAHHQPSQAFGPTPSRAAADVNAQNALSPRRRSGCGYRGPALCGAWRWPGMA